MTEKVRNFLIVGVVLTSLSLIAVFALFFNVMSDTSDLRHDNKKLSADLAAMQAQVDALKKGTDNSDLASRVNGLDTQVKALNTRGTKTDETLKSLSQQVKGYGLCIKAESGTNVYYISGIETASIFNGAKQCLDGSFVSVVPEEEGD